MLTSESLYESFLDSHVLVKQEQELHECWEARVCMRVFLTLMLWSNESKSCMSVDKREFVWEFSRLSCSGQTRTRVAWVLRSESLYEGFLNPHVVVKREQELHECWQARVCMRVFSTLMFWSNKNKSCMRVDKREFVWEFTQLSCPGQTRARVAWELRSESLYEGFLNSHVLVKQEQELHECWEARVCMRVFLTLMLWSNESKSCMSVDKREFVWEFSRLSCSGQTRTRVAWELTNESLYESLLNSHVLVKREQELHECWEARVCMRVFLKGNSSLKTSWS